MPKAAAPPPPDPALEGVTWFQLKHGAQQLTLFNSNCWVGTLMDQIKQTCGVVGGDVVCDLQDQSGALLDFHQAEPRLYATEKVRPAATYILVKVIAPADGPMTIEHLYEPAEDEGLPPLQVQATGKGKKS